MKITILIFFAGVGIIFLWGVLHDREWVRKENERREKERKEKENNFKYKIKK